MQRLAGIDKRLAAARAARPDIAPGSRRSGRCAAVDHVGRRVSREQFAHGYEPTREAAMAARRWVFQACAADANRVPD